MISCFNKARGQLGAGRRSSTCGKDSGVDGETVSISVGSTGVGWASLSTEPGSYCECWVVVSKDLQRRHGTVAVARPASSALSFPGVAQAGAGTVRACFILHLQAVLCCRQTQFHLVESHKHARQANFGRGCGAVSALQR